MLSTTLRVLAIPTSIPVVPFVAIPHLHSQKLLQLLQTLSDSTRPQQALSWWATHLLSSSTSPLVMVVVAGDTALDGNHTSESDAVRTRLIGLVQALIPTTTVEQSQHHHIWQECQIKYDHIIQRFIAEASVRQCFFFQIESPTAKVTTNSSAGTNDDATSPPHTTPITSSTSSIIVSSSPPQQSFSRLVVVLKRPYSVSSSSSTSAPSTSSHFNGRLDCSKRLFHHIQLYAVKGGSSGLNILSNLINEFYEPFLFLEPSNSMGLPNVVSKELHTSLQSLHQELLMAEGWLQQPFGRAILPIPKIEEIMLAELGGGGGGGTTTSQPITTKLTPEHRELIDSTRMSLEDLIRRVWKKQVDKLCGIERKHHRDGTTTTLIGEREKEEEHYALLCANITAASSSSSSSATSSSSLPSSSSSPSSPPSPGLLAEVEYCSNHLSQLTHLAHQLESPIVRRIVRMFEEDDEVQSNGCTNRTKGPISFSTSPYSSSFSRSSSNNSSTYGVYLTMCSLVTSRISDFTDHVRCLEQFRIILKDGSKELNQEEDDNDPSSTTSTKKHFERMIHFLPNHIERLLEIIEQIWYQPSHDDVETQPLSIYGHEPLRIGRLYRLLSNDVIRYCQQFLEEHHVSTTQSIALNQTNHKNSNGDNKNSSSSSSSSTSSSVDFFTLTPNGIDSFERLNLCHQLIRYTFERITRHRQRLIDIKRRVPLSSSSSPTSSSSSSPSSFSLSQSYLHHHLLSRLVSIERRMSILIATKSVCRFWQYLSPTSSSSTSPSLPPSLIRRSPNVCLLYSSNTHLYDCLLQLSQHFQNGLQSLLERYDYNIFDENQIVKIRTLEGEEKGNTIRNNNNNNNNRSTNTNTTITATTSMSTSTLRSGLTFFEVFNEFHNYLSQLEIELFQIIRQDFIRRNIEARRHTIREWRWYLKVYGVSIGGGGGGGGVVNGGVGMTNLVFGTNLNDLISLPSSMTRCISFTMKHFMELFQQLHGETILDVKKEFRKIEKMFGKCKERYTSAAASSASSVTASTSTSTTSPSTTTTARLEFLLDDSVSTTVASLRRRLTRAYEELSETHREFYPTTPTPTPHGGVDPSNNSTGATADATTTAAVNTAEQDEFDALTERYNLLNTSMKQFVDNQAKHM